MLEKAPLLLFVLIIYTINIFLLSVIKKLVLNTDKIMSHINKIVLNIIFMVCRIILMEILIVLFFVKRVVVLQGVS